MNSQRDKTKIIDYSPEELETFEVYSYEWIDNLNFTLSSQDYLTNPQQHIEIV